MIILYGHPESGHTCKVALTLQLAGLPFEYRWVDADFQAARRHGGIPVLVDDGDLDSGEFPRQCGWLESLRAPPRWRDPRDLLGKPT